MVEKWIRPGPTLAGCETVRVTDDVPPAWLICKRALLPSREMLLSWGALMICTEGYRCPKSGYWVPEGSFRMFDGREIGLVTEMTVEQSGFPIVLLSTTVRRVFLRVSWICVVVDWTGYGFCFPRRLRL